MEYSSLTTTDKNLRLGRNLREKIFTFLKLAFVSLRNGFYFMLIVWASLAIYYSNIPSPIIRLTFAILFFVFAVYALWIGGSQKWHRSLLVVFIGIFIWYAMIPASNYRPWRQEVELPPQVLGDGDHLRLLNYRNFVYRSRDDFDVRYEERDIDVARIVSLDLFVSYWQLGPVAHTFMSFNFDDGSPPVCISIETRPEIGESFDPLASLFKQFELIYVMGDERDIVRVRTDHRDENVFLYRIRARPDAVRAMFKIYVQRINRLAERPEWYHLLSNSCTINVIRYSRTVGGPHRRFSISHFLNGFIDAYLYTLGVLDTTHGFDELRKRSHINEAAQSAGDSDDFSALIRRGLPGVDFAQ